MEISPGDVKIKINYPYKVGQAEQPSSRRKSREIFLIFQLKNVQWAERRGANTHRLLALLITDHIQDLTAGSR